MQLMTSLTLQTQMQLAREMAKFNHLAPSYEHIAHHAPVHLHLPTPSPAKHDEAGPHPPDALLPEPPLKPIDQPHEGLHSSPIDNSGEKEHILDELLKWEIRKARRDKSKDIWENNRVIIQDNMWTIDDLKAMLTTSSEEHTVDLRPWPARRHHA